VIPYRALVNGHGEIIGIAREGRHLLHGEVIKLISYSVVESPFAAEYRLLGTWDDGRSGMVQVTFEKPALYEQRVWLQYWIINDCVSGEVFVWVGVLTEHYIMGTEVAQPVFVLYPAPAVHTKITGEDYAQQFNEVVAGIDAMWDNLILPWVTGLSGPDYSADDLIRNVREQTHVSKKYLDLAEADFEAAKGMSCWQYMVTLSSTIDQMTTNLFRRFDLRQRANKPVRVLVAAIDANNIQGGNDNGE
jgi:hypothetical protein